MNTIYFFNSASMNNFYAFHNMTTIGGTPANTPYLICKEENYNCAPSILHMPSPMVRKYNTIQRQLVEKKIKPPRTIIDYMLDLHKRGYNVYGKLSSRYASTSSASCVLAGGRSQSSKQSDSHDGLKSFVNISSDTTGDSVVISK